MWVLTALLLFASVQCHKNQFSRLINYYQLLILSVNEGAWRKCKAIIKHKINFTLLLGLNNISLIKEIRLPTLRWVFRTVAKWCSTEGLKADHLLVLVQNGCYTTSHLICNHCAVKSGGVRCVFFKSVSCRTVPIQFPAKRSLCQGQTWNSHHLHWEGDQSTHTTQSILVQFTQIAAWKKQTST